MTTQIIREMTPVDSLELAAIGYRNSNLVIQFHHGRTYEYFQIPYAEYEALLNSNDRANRFHNNIDGLFACKRIA